MMIPINRSQCIACTRVHLVNLKTGKVLGGRGRGLGAPALASI